MTTTNFTAPDITATAPTTPPEALISASLTGLRVTAITRDGDNMVSWSRWPGHAVDGPLRRCRTRPPTSDAEPFALICGKPIGDGVIYHLRSSLTIAEFLAKSLVPNSNSPAGRENQSSTSRLNNLLAALGRAVAAIPDRIAHPNEMGNDMPAAGASAILNRLTRRSTAANETSTTGQSADPLVAMYQLWGAARTRTLSDWAQEAADSSGQLIHGSLSLGSVVVAHHDDPVVEVMIGEDVGPGRIEWDLGVAVGDLSEIALSGPSATLAPLAAPWFKRAVASLLTGYRDGAGAVADGRLIARSAVLRMVAHQGDRIEYAGGALPPRVVLDQIAELIDTDASALVADSASGNRPPLRYQAKDLADHPAVDLLLNSAGLGSFRDRDVARAGHPDRQNGPHALGGRNDNWVGTTESGRQVIVKRVATAQSFQRSLAFQTLTESTSFDRLRTPELLAHHREDQLLIFALLPAARPLMELSLEGRFDPELGALAGQALAELHHADLRQTGHHFDDLPVMPPLGWLEGGMPWSAVQEFSMAQLWAWKAIQDDLPVVAGLRKLREDEAAAPRHPIHADLRLDQWIHSEGGLYLCDWEEFRLGDPARDLGTLIGEMVHHAFVGSFTTSSTTDTFEDTDRDQRAPLNHQMVLTRARASLEKARPSLRAVWTGYRSASVLADTRLADMGLADPEFADRCARFAGWHLFDRFLAAAEDQNTVSPIAKAAAGIGRSALLMPATLLALLEDS